MSIKLLPSSLSPIEPQVPDASNSLVLVHETRIAPGVRQIPLVPSADTFAWSSGTRSQANWIDGKPVEDSQGDETASSNWEYVSGAWSYPVGRTAVAQYLSYAANAANSRGRMINLYA